MAPVPPARPVWRDGRSVGNAEAWAGVDAVGAVLSGRYGPWAYYWHWGGPGESEHLGLIVRRIPARSEAPAFVAESLVVWRRWLDSLAERFDRFLPLLDPAHESEPADLVAAWEAAIAHLMMAAVAPTVDPDGWQGWCHRVLRWFLTAAGVPVDRATALVDDAFVGQRFDFWVPLTAADITDVAALPAGATAWVRESLGDAAVQCG
jgi:hypothetical protein